MNVETTDREVLRVRGLTVTFHPKGRRKAPVQAVRGIDLVLHQGETLSVVGESGCGKSTTARAVLGLVKAAGEIELMGRRFDQMSPREKTRARADIQMVFQDPYSSLDPSQRVGVSIAEPLEVHTDLDAKQRRARVEELLETVGLSAEHADRFPHDFSGGQRQRIAIARALACSPSIVVADEAVSALDVSTQNQVLKLLEELSSSLGVAYLFISHDLAVVRHISDRVAVMYLGTLVEEAAADALFAQPLHPYTQALLSSVLVADPARQRQRTDARLSGDLPDPSNPPSGCVFRTRCPHAMEVCSREVPVPVPRSGGGTVACHLFTEAHEGADPGEPSPTDNLTANGSTR
ncbi:oligopeptide/dipeptide ABC transporter ATP-binding protein [Nocardioides sp. AE5]|uniref:ABC transporter ATP-binding protein n=1 Tax=Nocardioides sp. AE5 TaxID=2962573 RepID=UPI002881E6E1|nr:oligopeptide/dipeptide ABC transporter ATP-binding protein [Nocardioides sp. AE5]MDT0203220.1 ATP-binding cassette domain-containing protein [Nocardioides sp. AE5]